MIDDTADGASTRGRERSGSTRKIGNGLLALSSAAVLTVYAAGYVKTRAAAERFATAERRPNAAPVRPAVPLPAPVTVAAPVEGPVQKPRPVATLPPPGSAPPKAARRTRRPAVAASAVPAEGAAKASPPATPAPQEPATPPDAKPSEPAPVAKPALKDGTYYGWGTSRHGDIQASVVIEGGRIVSASIAQCLTRYSCSWIEHLPGQVVSRQSPECDFVSGATQSTNAFYYAVIEALAQAK